MKNKFLKCCFVMSILVAFLLLVGCIQNPADKENDLGKTYKVDFSGLSGWSVDGTFNFDKESGKLTISKAFQGGSVWLSYFDASNYNYLEVKYSQAKGSFAVSAEYSDKTSTMVGCPEYDNAAYITLNPEKKGNLSSIMVQSYSNEVSVKLESLTFTDKKPELAAIVDKKDGNFESSISAIDFAKKMRVGWNLSNSLDAHSGDFADNPKELGLASETFFVLDQPYTTKEIIHLPRENGYSSIRIPVTWYNHIIDDDYTIDPKWMARVKQVVDWAIEDGYYVILNEHHSKHEKMSSPLKYGEGYIVRNTPEDIAESERFLKAIWTQITTAFNGSYDEHLIFEFMNEPSNVGHNHEWNPGLVTAYADYSTCEECIADYEILNEYNQICLDAIRSTGGNNSKRFLIVPGLCELEEPLLHKLFKLPEDTAHDKLMVTTHNYEMGVYPEYVKNEYTTEIENKLADLYAKLNDAYIKKGIPVIVGETHTLRSIPYAERVKWAKSFYKIASSYGMPVLYWEDAYNLSNHFDRKTLEVIEPEFVKLMLDSWQCE